VKAPGWSRARFEARTQEPFLPRSYRRTCGCIPARERYTCRGHRAFHVQIRQPVRCREASRKAAGQPAESPPEAAFSQDLFPGSVHMCRLGPHRLGNPEQQPARPIYAAGPWVQRRVIVFRHCFFRHCFFSALFRPCVHAPHLGWPYAPMHGHTAEPWGGACPEPRGPAVPNVVGHFYNNRVDVQWLSQGVTGEPRSQEHAHPPRTPIRP